MSEKIVIALGGNAFMEKNGDKDVKEQWRRVYEAAEQLAKIVLRGYKVLITHGNGPQIGNILEWMEALRDKIPPLTMDIANAMTQGWLGYMIQQALGNKLVEHGVQRRIVTIISQVLVDPGDPAFRNPVKYIGPYYSEEEAKRMMAERKWIMKPDPRGGWRRVVASPLPLDIVEIDAVRILLEKNYIVIASGGGGIPVYDENGLLRGVEAVVDKDLAALLLAKGLQADYLMILTDVEGVMLDYGTPRQRLIRRLSIDEAEELYQKGYFPAGSMGPKVLACIEFIRGGGKKAYIGHLHKAIDIIDEKTGTMITP